MSSQQDTPITVFIVIFVSPNDWDEWLEVIKSKANTNRVWQYVNLPIFADDLPKLKKLI